MNITTLVRAIEDGFVLVREHAVEEAENDCILITEVYDSVSQGEIIEFSSQGCKAYPSCLIYGQSASGRHIHSWWAYNHQKQLAILKTVYDPSKSSWLWSNDYRKRRRL